MLLLAWYFHINVFILDHIKKITFIRALLPILVSRKWNWIPLKIHHRQNLAIGRIWKYANEVPAFLPVNCSNFIKTLRRIHPRPGPRFLSFGGTCRTIFTGYDLQSKVIQTANAFRRGVTTKFDR
ncbi:MAG: hypothetical protein NTW21_14450 [Verrucomicrobia bacterium]|nr:hypothetical protein [Verrucomicrobiota bacterium]